MGQLKWYKRDPEAALSGMMELDLQERGAYNTVLDLLYSRDGNLPDDDRFIAGWLRVDVRVWKRLKITLVERGKLYLHDGQIRNNRADVEVLAALSRVASASDAGRASARSKAGKPDAVGHENNDLAATVVPTGVSTTVSTNYNHNHKEDSEEAKASPAASAAPIDLVKVIFDSGRTILGVAGHDDRQARSIIGRWRKTFGDPAVLIALSSFGNQLHPPEQPVEWITGSLKSQAKQGNGNGNYHTPIDRRDGFERALDRRIDAGRSEQPPDSAERSSPSDGGDGGELAPARVAALR